MIRTHTYWLPEVQATRGKTKDINTFPPISFMPISLLTVSSSFSLNTNCLVQCRIIPRSCSNITFTVDNWTEIDKKRRDLYGDNVFDMNFFELSGKTKAERLMVWEFGEKVFPDLKSMNEADKQAILCNFYPRWMMMCSAVDYSANHEKFSKFLGTDEYYEALGKFYGSCIPKKQRMGKSECIRIFSPYWDWHYEEVADPIYQKKCDKVECTAIFLLLLFDFGELSKVRL